MAVSLALVNTWPLATILHMQFYNWLTVYLSFVFIIFHVI